MSDEQRAYFLNKLTPEERSRLEERMFADDEFFELMLDAENDLADAYAAGRLPPRDAATFAAARSELMGRRHRITVAKALFAREQLAGSDRPAYREISLRKALTLAAGLVAVSIAAWVYKARTTVLLPTARTTAQRFDDQVVSVLLTSTVTRDRNASRSIMLPNRAEELRVTIAVPSVAPNTALHAELRAAAGNLVWQGTPQSWEGNSPVFLISVHQVPSGAAELNVFAGADRHLAGVYPLRFERF